MTGQGQIGLSGRERTHVSSRAADRIHPNPISQKRPTSLSLGGINRYDSYCGVGPHRVTHRALVDEHLKTCINTKIDIVGVNSELTIGQWEFQIGHDSDGIKSCDDLVVARFLLERISEKYGVVVSYDVMPKQHHIPFCHINFSTKQMTDGVSDEVLMGLSEIFLEDSELHLSEFGGDSSRFNRPYTPSSEGCTIGFNDKTTTINFVEDKNYFEDRRPPANIDPYKACKILTKSINKIFG